MDQVCLCKLGERKHTELAKPQRRSAWPFISVSQQFTSHRASLGRKADGAARRGQTAGGGSLTEARIPLTTLRVVLEKPELGEFKRQRGQEKAG